MKKAIASVGLLALGALGIQNTQAQLVAGAEKPWSIAGTLRGFYDDNYDTQPDGPGRHGSFGFELRPSAKVNLVEGQTTVNLSYIYSYKYFEDRQTGKADQSHDVEFFLNHNFDERYSIDVSDSFVIAQEPEILDQNLSLIDRANGNNLRNTAAINFHAQVTRLLGFVLGYSNTFYDYEQNAGNTDQPLLASYSALLDRMEQFAHIDGRLLITDTTTGILGYQFGWVTYNSDESIANASSPLSPIFGYPHPGGADYVAPDTRNNRSHAIYGGIDHSFRSNLSFSGRAGIEIVDYYQAPPGNASSDVSPYVDLSLNYTYADGGVLVVGFRNAHNQTDLGAASNGAGGFLVTEDEDSSTFYANVTQTLKPISPKLTGTLSFQYQNSRINQGPFNDQTESFYLIGLNFSYQFTHYLSGELGYNYDLVASDLAGRGYERNRVYIGLTASY